VRDEGPEIELDREGDKWKIVKPAQYAADPTQVRQVLTTLADAKVADFVSDAPADVTQYGLVKPHLTISVYNGKTIESLLFGFKQKESGKDGVYVRRGERAAVYTVHQWLMSSIDKSVLELRDKTVLSFDPSKVETVKVESDGKQFTLKRAAGGKWDLAASGVTSPADAPVVERFLDQIRDLKGNSLVMDPMRSPEMFGMDRPQMIATLLDKDGKQVGQLKLSKIEVQPAPGAEAPSAGPRTDYYAASSASGALYSTDGFLFSQLNKSADQFRARSAPAASATPKK